jgi:hypothetical protein
MTISAPRPGRALLDDRLATRTQRLQTQGTHVGQSQLKTAVGRSPAARRGRSSNCKGNVPLDKHHVSDDHVELSQSGLSVIQNRFGCSPSEAQALFVRYAVRVELPLLEITRGLLDEDRRGGILEEMREM